MTRPAGPATRTIRAADAVQSWFAGARDLRPDRLVTWRGSAGDCAIEFFCTNRATAEAAAARLMRGQTNERPSFRLGLLETDALGWASPSPCESQRQSLALAGELGERGLVAVIPVRGCENGDYPWTVFDTATRCGLVIVRGVDELPPWSISAPFTVLLHFALACRGWRLLHAASLGLDGRGALIVGPGGVGKSATTISGVLQGLSTVGDDYLALEFGDPPRAWPVYRVVKQAPAGLARLPSMSEKTAGMTLNWQGKAELDAERLRPDCIAASLTIAAILIPERLDGPKTIFEPASPSAAFSALAPSTLSQLPGGGLAGFSQMTRLTRGLPAFRLRLSPDAEEVGASLRHFFAGLSP